MFLLPPTLPIPSYCPPAAMWRPYIQLQVLCSALNSQAESRVRVPATEAMLALFGAQERHLVSSDKDLGSSRTISLFQKFAQLSNRFRDRGISAGCIAASESTYDGISVPRNITVSTATLHRSRSLTASCLLCMLPRRFNQLYSARKATGSLAKPRDY